VILIAVAPLAVFVLFVDGLRIHLKDVACPLAQSEHRQISMMAAPGRKQLSGFFDAG